MLISGLVCLALFTLLALLLPLKKLQTLDEKIAQKAVLARSRAKN